MKVHYSSKKQDWGTPQALFDTLNAKYHFTLDVCAHEGNHKCDRYFSPEEDGLAQSWYKETCWMNPPYGREISKWTAKALQESAEATVIGLLPARTDTRWFHECIVGKANIYFIARRIRFQGAPYNAPFPSMIVRWDEDAEKNHWSITKEGLFV